MTDILIIPDCHTRPGEDNITRFEAIGNLLVARQPDIIVHLGDHWDMASLSRFDEGLEAMEGQRHGADIEAGQEALDAMQAIVDQYNKGRKKKYDPQKEMLEGNHEFRQELWLKKYPKFRDTFGRQSFGLEERGWNVTYYKQKLFLEGFIFMHYFENKMGKPLSSITNVGNTINSQLSISGLAGHSHLYQTAHSRGADGRRYFSGTLGWLGALDQVEGYAEATMFNWVNGLTYLWDVNAGYGNPELILQERLLKEYL